MYDNLNTHPRSLRSRASEFQSRQINTMPAFSRALRAQHPNESCASSIYSIPAHEAIDRTSDLSPPQTQQPPAQPRPKAERQPLRIMTRTGKTLCADGVFRNANEESELKPSRTRSIRTRTGKTLCADGAFRNAKGEDELKPSKTRSSDAFSFTYDHKRAEAAQLPKVEQYGTIDIVFEQANVEPAKAEAKQTGCGDGIQQAAVPLHELTAQQVFDEPVVVSKSRYVVAETTSKPPARRPSLVRRLSDSVKDAFRSRSKRRISVPLELQHRPHLNDNVLHPDIKAIPLAEAQKRMAGGQKLSFADHDRLRQQMLNGARAKDHPDHGPAAQKWPSDLRLRNFVPEASAGAPDTRPLQQPTSNSKDQATPTRARSVKVVGHADRATRFSDFMNASVSSNEDLNNYHPGTKLKLPSLPLRDQFSRPELAPQPLDVPNRKPVPSHISYPVRKESLRKRVDTSQHSWLRQSR